VCGRQLRKEDLGPGYDPVLPKHMTESRVTCSGSSRTLEAAEDLAALRLRAHP
jgi:hypothetical protein